MNQTEALLIPGFFTPRKSLSKVKETIGNSKIAKLNHFNFPKQQAIKLNKDFNPNVVIGHSKGGLTAIELANISNSVEKVITINTPFGKVFGAPVFKIDKKRDYKIFNIYSKKDKFIRNKESRICKLDDCENLELEVNGHFKILLSKELLDTIAKIINS